MLSGGAGNDTIFSGNGFNLCMLALAMTPLYLAWAAAAFMVPKALMILRDVRRWSV